MKTVILTLLGAVVLGGLVGAAPKLAQSSAIRPVYNETVTGCTVTDGDTIRCNDERIRLLGIDAPELPGHCPSYRRCVAGDPVASTDSLRDAMSWTMQIKRVGEDDYGRTLAIVAGQKGDLSCWQLAHRQAIYKSDWDNGYNVARLCPGATF